MTEIRVWTHIIKTCPLSYFYSSNLRGKKRKDMKRQDLEKTGHPQCSIIECSVYGQYSGRHSKKPVVKLGREN